MSFVTGILFYIIGYGYKRSSKTFIFSLRNKDKLVPFRSYAKNAYQNYAVYVAPHYGPTFGGGHDLHINNGRDCYTYFGWTFSGPRGYYGGHINSMELLAGTYSSKPTEVEVYYLH